MYIVVGLGNPGEQYLKTRHNTGRMVEEYVSESLKKQVKFIYLESFMNKSGQAVGKVVKSKKAAEKLVIIYDDLDLPLGTLKVSYDRGSGGHKGLKSVIRALKTREFIRLRIGIASITPFGKIKKPKGEAKVEKHILGNFKKSELEILKKVFKKAREVIETIVDEGYEQAMNRFN